MLPVPRRVSEQSRFHDAFVSYSRRDRDVVVELVRRLRARGHDIWFDEAIRPSAKFLGDIKSAIENSRNFLPVLSPSFVASEFCQLETHYASELSKRALPVRIAEVRELPREIADFHVLALPSVDDEATLDQVSFWIKNTPEDEDERTRLLDAALAWKDARGSLLRGRSLRRADAWLVTAEPNGRVLPEISGYILASHRAAHRRRSIAGVITAGVLLLAAFGWWQTGRHGSRRIARVAEVESSRRPALAIALARAAVAPGSWIWPDDEARDGLRRVLTAPLLMDLPHAEAVGAVALAPAGTLTATASGSRATIWDWRRGAPIQTITAGSWVKRVAFRAADDGTPSGDEALVLASVDRTAQVWIGDENRWEAATSIVHPASVLHAAFAARDRIVTAATDGGARLVAIDPAACELRDARDAVSFEQQGIEAVLPTTAPDHVVSVGATMVALRSAPHWQPGLVELPSSVVDVGSDGRWLGVATADGRVTIRDATSGAVVAESGSREWPGLTAIAVHSATRLASLAAGSEIELVAIEPGGRLETVGVLRGHGDSVRALAFSDDGALLASASNDHTARVWRVTRETRGVAEVSLEGGGSAVATDPSGRFVAVGDVLGVVRVVDTHSGLVVTRAEMPSHQNIAALAFDPVRPRLLVASVHGELRFHDPSSGAALGDLARHPILRGETALLERVALAEDGGRLVTARGSSVRSWDVTTDTPVEIGSGFGATDPILAATPLADDGVAIVTRCRFAVLDPASGRPMSRPELEQAVDELIGGSEPEACRAPLVAAALGARSSLVANAERVLLLDLSSAVPRHAILGTPDGDPIEQVLLSPSGERAVVVGRRATTVWDVRGARPARFGMPLVQPVKHAALSPDGTLLAFAGALGPPSVWAIASGEIQQQVAPADAAVEVLAFGPGGRHLATAGSDSVLRTYRRELFAPFAEVEDLAARRSTRDLTTEERQRYCIAPSLSCAAAMLSGDG